MKRCCKSFYFRWNCRWLVFNKKIDKLELKVFLDAFVVSITIFAYGHCNLKIIKQVKQVKSNLSLEFYYYNLRKTLTLNNTDVKKFRHCLKLVFPYYIIDKGSSFWKNQYFWFNSNKAGLFEGIFFWGEVNLIVPLVLHISRRTNLVSKQLYTLVKQSI